MSAIVLLIILINAILVTSQDSENATQSSCIIDSRVSMLRCVSVSQLKISQALNQWNLTSISRLEISRTNLGTLETPLTTERKLRLGEISIVNCGLEIFGDQALDNLDFNELESIDLSWNMLMQVPGVVLRLGKLRHLDLSHNKIFSLPPGSSFNNLNALATLKLSGNK